MEEGVVKELLKGPLRKIFDSQYLVTDVSGSGNNWAVGHLQYGSLHHEELCEIIRKSAELCDCLQCFFMLHSMGGEDDDVITSPYNTVLALHELTELADCVIPVDNFALVNILNNLKKEVKTDENKVSKVDMKNGKPFDEMNNLVATMLLNMTSSSRFQGSMNVDLNEITMNLVPFPRLHYLIASQSPLTFKSKTIIPRKVDQIFSDAFSHNYQFVSLDPLRHTYLAAALLLRGSVSATSIRENIDRLQRRLQFIPWNREGWKVGHCLVPPINQKYHLLTLSNNTAIYQSFNSILNRFHKLYRRKAHLHHYNTVSNFDNSFFETSVNSLKDLSFQYESFEQQAKERHNVQLPRLTIMD